MVFLHLELVMLLGIKISKDYPFQFYITYSLDLLPAKYIKSVSISSLYRIIFASDRKPNMVIRIHGI